MQEKQLNPYKDLALRRKLMYRFERYRQPGLADFNQPAVHHADRQGKGYSTREFGAKLDLSIDKNGI